MSTVVSTIPPISTRLLFFGFQVVVYSWTLFLSVLSAIGWMVEVLPCVAHIVSDAGGTGSRPVFLLAADER